jgi:hypothetical protein
MQLMRVNLNTAERHIPKEDHEYRLFSTAEELADSNR